MDVTPEMLVELECRFAPVVATSPAVFSPQERIRKDAENAGGDKMASDRNGYADFYAEVLSGLRPARIVEVGVFQGSSLAMWCDLFPDAEVVGLDLDFVRYGRNLPFLRDAGAFARCAPRLVEWDAYSEAAPDVGGPVDLFVDDGPHTEPAIRNALRLFGPVMSAGGVYVVEDYAGAGRLLSEAFPDGRVVSSGRIAAARL